jgi:NitT/TauT family transport system ATP-binding protein
MSFKCVDLSLTFTSLGLIEALDKVNISVSQGEFVCIVGPSGCGKTTLLKLIAGLLVPSRGRIEFSGQQEIGRPRTAMVFQNQGLFPWMTVLENVAFGLEMRGVSKNERSKKATELINRVGLGDFSKAYPFQLSGGMRQRTAIMRAFLSDPQVLLMDEPFAALDAQTRFLMQEELLDTWLSNPKTVIYVTHDIEEAIYLGDRVLVMSGRPGTIQADIPIIHPRPRLHSFRKSEEFDLIQQRIWELIKVEVKQSLRLA